MSSQRFAAKYRHLMVLLALWIVATIVYVPGLRGPFVFDDQHNITYNLDVAINQLDLTSLRKAALSNQSGPLKRPIAGLTFGLNHYAAGGFANTFPFKITNLIIHLLNTTLIYWLSHLLLARTRAAADQARRDWHIWLPALIAAAWALHPIQLTSVLYVVQRMTSLSGLFVLSGLIGFIYGRLRLERGGRYAYTLMTAGLLGGLLLGMLSKENAVLLLLFALVVELIFFHGFDRNSKLRRNLAIYYGMLVLLPCLLALAWLIVNPDFLLGTYNTREFTLTQRLLTEPRVLWFYVSLIFVPRGYALGLFHDDIPISLGLLEPWTTLVAALGLVTFVFAAIIGRHRYPLLSFAVLWFVVGHSMESGIIGLEIAHEHRNYLPTFGIIFSSFCGLTLALNKVARPAIVVALSACYIAAFGIITYARALVWTSENKIIETLVRNHPGSARAHYMLGQVYAQQRGNPLGAIRHYKKAGDLSTTDAEPLVQVVITASGTTVRPSANDMAHDAVSTLTIPGFPDFVSIQSVHGRRTLVVDKTVTEEIERRLAEEPVRAHTGYALGLLSSCINREPRNCRHLYETAVKWYKLALANPTAGNIARGYLASGLARLYLEYGDYEKALTAARKSREYDSSKPDHWLQEADIYIHLSQLDKAEQIIMQTQRLAGYEHSREAEVLLEKINARRSRRAGKEN